MRFSHYLMPYGYDAANKGFLQTAAQTSVKFYDHNANHERVAQWAGQWAGQWDGQWDRQRANKSFQHAAFPACGNWGERRRAH